ncbi:MAG: MiaB/RimO family radical SAM methylthiotransferase [bacterium]|nr:MiaB/RimO family radical SAM methylthiotransferase [bacterium]
MKKVSFKTIGCRLNKYDTEWLRESFESVGFQSVDSASEICVVNTCAVTLKACRESRNIIRHQAKQGMNIIVTGCGAKLIEKELKNVKNILFFEPSFEKVVTDYLKSPLISGIKSFYGHSRAFVKVQEGCDQFCSYCVVPHLRGKPSNRNFEDIISEVERLRENGFKEFTLTGTNLGKYNRLVDLLKSVEQIPDVHRVGLSSIEPIGISDELINFVAGSSKFSKYFHIPMQSGDEKVLKSMNRWYSPADFSDLIVKLKSNIPGVAIGTDIIVGFPGEGEKEFLNTYDLVSKLPIDKLHVFRYSRRPLTKALEFKDEVQDETKKQRSQLIYELGEKKWEQFRTNLIGKTLEVHIENAKHTKSKEYTGITSNYIKVSFSSDKKLDDFVNVRLERIEKQKTYGQVVEN